VTLGRSVLVLNAGSSSLKWVVLNAESEAVERQGQTSWDGTDANRHASEFEAALAGVRSVHAVGHRVVHGGTRFSQGVRVDDTVRDEIAQLAELAPLHNPAAVAGIDAARVHLPGVPQVAAFDTAFHTTMPEATALYPLPWEWTARWQLRRFGFHGLSVSYAIGRTHQLLRLTPRRVVVCHLGAGCSVTAVADGHSVNTSMGFTPLEGVMMAQRSGSVDPGLLLYLMARRGMSAEEVEQGLNERSGLLGVSGISADMRQVLAAAEAGQERARLARDMFVQRVVSSVGAMLTALGGLDVLVFTAGIGEHSAVIRDAVGRAFDYVGLRLDPAANEASPADRDISQPDSAVRVLVISAREDLAILRQVKQVLGWS
jgi:acetate kinase